MQETQQRQWDTLRQDTAQRLAAAEKITGPGKLVRAKDVVKLLEAVIRPGDKINLEGNNQKQADFLAERLCRVDPEKIHGLHLVQSAIALDSHTKLFEKGIAEKIDFSYSGAQAGKLAQAVQEGKVKLGDIHTYLELFGRYFIDLVPRVALVAAYQADKDGNLYTGSNTEDTPVIVEATKFKQGIVIAQVNEVVDHLPRVDIPGDWVDFVVQSPRPFYLEPLFTRDPALITDAQILRAMMAIKGIYAEYGVQTVNHGIGFDTAAIELLLPTYGEELGLKGKICTSFALNPHPTLIPAIESGWVKNIHCFGGELGMEEYVKARPDVFFVGPDGSPRSNRTYAQIAGHYAVDLFIGGTLQIDEDGNSSTATASRIAGFGGAPNMGCDPHGRRHASEAWLKCGAESGPGGAAPGDLPGEDGPRLCGAAGRLGAPGEGRPGSSPGDDLRRRPDPHRDRRGHRLSAQVPQPGGAPGGHPGGGRLYQGRPQGRSRGDPGPAGRRDRQNPGGSGHRPGQGQPEPAGGKERPGSGQVVWRAVSAPRQIQKLVRRGMYHGITAFGVLL